MEIICQVNVNRVFSSLSELTLLYASKGILYPFLILSTTPCKRSLATIYFHNLFTLSEKYINYIKDKNDQTNNVRLNLVDVLFLQASITKVI